MNNNRKTSLKCLINENQVYDCLSIIAWFIHITEKQWAFQWIVKAFDHFNWNRTCLAFELNRIFGQCFSPDLLNMKQLIYFFILQKQ